MSQTIKYPVFLLLLFFGLVLNGFPYSFHRDIGLNYLKNYTPGEYSHHPQNWTITRTKSGFVYAANQAGILEYDGVSWRIIPVPNISARSICIDENDFVYVGGKNEIGFLSPNSSGKMIYSSLMPYVLKTTKNPGNFSDVWNTLSTKDGIYFRTSKYLLRWNKKEIKIWETPFSFKASFYSQGKLYIQQENAGLLRMVNESLIPIPGGDQFKTDKISMMVPLNSGKFLIGIATKGFFIYDEKTVVPFITGADEYLKANQMYNGIQLSSGDFAIATLRGGLVIIDPNGKLKHIFDKSSGLQDDDIKNVFEDNEGNLWLPLNNGITKIEYLSPLSVYDSRMNLPGMILSVIKHQDVLYAGTNQGLYFLDSTFYFKPVPGCSGMFFSLLPDNDSLLAASNNGVFQIEKYKDTAKVISTKCTYALIRSLIEPNRIWAGTESGLVSFVFKNSNWIEENSFGNLSTPIHTIVEDRNRTLWLGTLTQGVIKLDFPGFPGHTLNPVITRYNTAHSLPSGEVNIFFTANHTIFATEKGIFRFDENKKVFIPDYTLGTEYANGSKNVFRIAEDDEKNIWFHSKGKNFCAALNKDQTYRINAYPFSRIPIAQVNSIFSEKEVVWFGSVDGLIRFDKRTPETRAVDFQAYIRSVSIKGKPLVFDTRKPPGLPFKNFNMRIHFAAPFFKNEKKTRYRYFLEGFDEGWSSWKRETRKDYTNLDPGFYTFRVQALNIIGQVSNEGRFQFIIRAPWYRAWWAYFIYGIVLTGFIVLLVRFRSWKLIREKRHLEGIIEDRTREILAKNHQLEDQTQKLEDQSVKLKEMDRVKSRFFANISHEFRTPLTLIIGPLENILSLSHVPSKAELDNDAKLMLRNSQRLLHLVNQLLDLSHLESGKMKLQVSEQDIVAFLRVIVESFQSLAHQQKLDLLFIPGEENLRVYIDTDKMEKVIGNLLSNAVKFTPPDGKVKVAVRKGVEVDPAFPSGYLEIIVSDTGIGIPPDRVEHIFERFYQVHSSHEYRKKGTGIGLALTRELVILHRGDIRVRSWEASEETDSGSEFILRLPLGKEHWHEEEIIDISDATISHEINSILPVWNDKDDSREIQSEEKSTLAPGGEKQEVILVVEDSVDMRRYICEALIHEYKVVEAIDGLQGIEKAKEMIPDLIVSDIMMPGADGYRLCSQLKKDIDTSHIPIILLTARFSEESVIEGFETGADDYITKPFNTRVLLARIKNLIELRRQMQLKRQRQMTMQPLEIAVTSLDETFYNEVQAVIEKNLSDSDFNVEQLSKKLYMSRTSLYTKILALTGEPPTQFIRSYRLKRAAQLLKANYGNVTEVAFAVGFSSTPYFTKCFKEMFHQLPSSYQASEYPEE